MTPDTAECLLESKFISAENHCPCGHRRTVDSQEILLDCPVLSEGKTVIKEHQIIE